MTTIELASIGESTQSRVVIGKSRRFAAVVAIVFPAVAVALVLGALIKAMVDPLSLLTHPVFLILLVPGIGALIFWCRRYIRPALFALRNGEAVYVERGVLSVLGRQIPVTGEMILSSDTSVLSLSRNREEVLRAPSYFISISSPATQS
jgi:hypothetical protein